MKTSSAPCVAKMVDFGFYRDIYGGCAIPEADWHSLAQRAQDVLDSYQRKFRVAGDEKARAMALCAMAETLDYFQAALNGEGALRYASVGNVSVSGKGIYAQLDISPKVQERELYRAAGRYLDFCRAV